MLPKKGTVLDVGSSVGLMLLPYKKMGWKIIGNDPDLTFVEYGKKKYNLPIECIQSEDMKLRPLTMPPPVSSSTSLSKDNVNFISLYFFCHNSR